MDGMVSKFEREYLQDYARNDYSGAGEIVDLGCWMGATTVELATGLQQNPNPELRNRTIHAFDLFLWHPWMNNIVLGKPLEGKYQEGESFLDEFLNNTKPWAHQVKAYAGDLTQKDWTGEPVEFLFIDAMKSWALLNTIVQQFFPSLIPGKSIVVQQDFTYFLTYWIHLIMYRFRDYFEPVYDVPFSPSFAFRYIKELPQDWLQATYSSDSFSTDEIEAAFAYASDLVPLEKKPIILSAQVLALLEKRGISVAEASGLGMKALYKAQNQTVYLSHQVQQHKSRADEAQNELRRLKRAEQDLLQFQEKLKANPGLGGQLTSLQKELQQAQQELEHSNAQLEQSNETIRRLQNEIAALQSSKFWKLRNVWFQFKHLLGFS